MSWAIYGSFEVEVWDERKSDGSDGALDDVLYSAAAADLHVFTILRPITVMALGLWISVTYNVDAVAQVVSLDKRVTYGSDTGRVELTSITVIDAWTAGQQKVKWFNGVDLDIGQQLVIEQKVQGTSGGAGAGACNPYIYVAPRSEIPDLMTALEEI